MSSLLTVLGFLLLTTNLGFGFLVTKPGYTEVDTLRVSGTIEGEAILNGTSLMDTSVTQAKMNLEEPTHDNQAVTKGYLEKLYGKTLSELRILLNEPFIISSVAVIPSSETIVVEIPSIIQSSFSWSLVATPEVHSSTGKAVCTVISSTATHVTLKTATTSDTGITVDRLNIMFFGMQESIESTAFAQLLSVTDPVKSAPVTQGTLNQYYKFIQPWSDDGTRFCRMNTGDGDIQCYNFIPSTITAGSMIDRIDILNFVKIPSKAIAGQLGGTNSAVATQTTVNFGTTFASPPVVILTTFDINSSGQAACCLTAVTTTSFTLNCFNTGGVLGAADGVNYMVKEPDT